MPIEVTAAQLETAKDLVYSSGWKEENGLMTKRIPVPHDWEGTAETLGEAIRRVFARRHINAKISTDNKEARVLIQTEGRDYNRHILPLIPTREQS